MGRTKPETGVRKLLCLGPRSGLVYPVEDFAEIGVIVVRAPNKGAVAQFQRLSVREPGRPGLVYQTGQGDPELLRLIREDFAVTPKLEAVGPVNPVGEAAKKLTPEERELYWSSLAYRAPETLNDVQKRIVDAMKDEPHPKNPRPVKPAGPPPPRFVRTKASTPSGI